LECGSPLPLSDQAEGLVLRQSAKGPGHCKTWRMVLAFSILHSAFCLRALGQSYSIDWSTIDGGGGTSSNGQYSLSGTIGQPDAGATMSGGSFSLDGGFWGVVAAVQTTGAPLLTIALTTTNTVILAWPSPSTGFGLEQSDSLSTPNWSSVVGTPDDNGTSRSVTVFAGSGNKFYRLKK
jgi:hypothetical protein